MKEKTLGQDVWFWSFIGLGAAVALISSGFIIFSDNLAWCGSSTCFTGALEIFRFPIQAFTAGIALATLRALMFRSEQTAKQIEVANKQVGEAIKQNTFKNYFDHKKDFLERLKSFENEYEVLCEDKNTLYHELFPFNNPLEFSPVSRSADSDLPPLFYRAKVINEKMEMLVNNSTLLDKSETLRFIAWLKEIVTAMGEAKLRFKPNKENECQVSMFHDENGCFLNGYERWNSFPIDLETGIGNLAKFFELLCKYCALDPDLAKISNISKYHGPLNEQLKVVCSNTKYL